MKFLVTKDLAHSTLLTYLMVSVVCAILIYLSLDIVLHAHVIGLDMHIMQATLFGDEANYIEPILLDSLLLQVHIDLFMTLFTILILSAIYIRLYSSKVMTRWIVHLLCGLGIAVPVMLILAYFTGPVFVLMWLISFVVWHVLAFIVGIMILKRLLFT